MLELKGHLFDTLSINKTLDILYNNRIKSTVIRWNVGFGVENPTSCFVKIISDKNLFPRVFEDLKELYIKNKIEFELNETK